MLTVGDPAARRHQFLISLERPHDGGSFALDTGVRRRCPTRSASAARWRIEGVGTLELTAAERDGMHRIDVRELNQRAAIARAAADAVGVPLSAQRRRATRRWRWT